MTALKSKTPIIQPVLNLIDGAYLVIASHCEYTSRHIEHYNQKGGKQGRDLEAKEEIRKMSVEFFERLAKLKGHANYVDFVMGQLKTCIQDDPSFWPRL